MIEHQGLTESVEAEFGGVVAGAAAECVLTGEAGDVDDEAAAALAESREGFVGAVEGSIEVEIDVAVPIFHRHLADFPEDTETGIVDEDVEAAEGVVNGFEERADLVGAADIGGMAEDFAASAEFGAGALDGFFGSAAESNGGALVQQAFDDGPADSAGAAGDERDFAGE